VSPRDNPKSLQSVLRQRRPAQQLLSPEEARRREAARRVAAEEEEARELVERWLSSGRLVDGRAKLSPGLYRAVFRTDRRAYFASSHWSRTAKRQFEAVGACEVARCRSTADLRARHLHHETLGAEEAGRDLMTLCDGCRRRVRRRERELGHLLSRDEVRRTDPHKPLYDPAAIAALKARYRRPLRQSDL
jgi:hypothetical protein